MKKLLSELTRQVGQDPKSRFCSQYFLPSRSDSKLYFQKRSGIFELRQILFLNRYPSNSSKLLHKIENTSQDFGENLLPTNGPQRSYLNLLIKLTQGFLFILTLQETPVKTNNRVQISCSFNSSPMTHLCQMLKPGQQWSSLVRSRRVI